MQVGPKTSEALSRLKITAARPKTPPKTPPSASEARPRTPPRPDQAARNAQARVRHANLDPYDRAVKIFRNQAKPLKPRPGSKRDKLWRFHALADAYCVWSDVDEVVRTYVACGVMNELGWDTYCVDHTVPLSNPIVCGLHTHTNLRVISHRENMLKGNHVWPGMPEVNWGTIDLVLSGP